MIISEIDAEAVQEFLNQQKAEGKAFNSLKNLKWGLSSVFASAVEHKYIKANPVREADLPPADIKGEAELPTASQLNLLIADLPEPLATAVCLVAVNVYPAGGTGVQVVGS